MADENSFYKIEPIAGEPWVKLPNSKELAAWDKENEIIYNQTSRQTQKLAFYAQIFDFLAQNFVDGDYYEFGCHRVRTFRMALTEAKRHKLDKMNFYAFDSFEGLPKSSTDHSVPYWQQGALATSEEEFLKIVKEHGVYTDKIQTIKGFFSDSLTPALSEKFNKVDSKASLICVDCDFYESAVPVFKFIEPYIQEGTVIYLDDYFVGYKGSPVKGVAKAFHEFEKYSKLKWAQHMQIGWWGRSYIAYKD